METKIKMPTVRQALKKLNNILAHASFPRKEEAERMLQVLIKEYLRQGVA